MLPPLEAFFHPAPDGGQRLYLHHSPPAGTPLRGAVLYVHPWAEEMNKSRRMAALASRALASDGWAVLQIDLLGCGDSSGNFGDATWEAWVDDVARAARWLQERHTGVPLWLWGLRAGALLAADTLNRLDTPAHLLLWQPAQQGKALLQQFLRLKAAAELADGGGKAILDAARADLAAGGAVEVAGYTLTAALAQGLERGALAPPSPRQAGTCVVWLETTAAADTAISPAAQAALTRWRAAGWITEARAVSGPAFWQTTEIEDAPNLVEATIAALHAAPVPSTDNSSKDTSARTAVAAP